MYDGDHSRDTESSGVDSINGGLADPDENRTQQGTGRSHVTLG